MGYGFHAKNGLFFEGDAEGNVTVRVTRESEESRRRAPLFQVTLDADTWASALASVSKKGDTAANFQLARNFHLGNILHAISKNGG